MGWDGTGINCYGMGSDRKICPMDKSANLKRKIFTDKKLKKRYVMIRQYHCDVILGVSGVCVVENNRSCGE